MKTGEIEVEAKDVKILNTCRNSLPLELREFHQVNY
jgi:aspartyl-tRNA synthetase